MGRAQGPRGNKGEEATTNLDAFFGRARRCPTPLLGLLVEIFDISFPKVSIVGAPCGGPLLVEARAFVPFAIPK